MAIRMIVVLEGNEIPSLKDSIKKYSDSDTIVDVNNKSYLPIGEHLKFYKNQKREF